jgi:SOS response regulatory protein OraA/RecX
VIFNLIVYLYVKGNFSRIFQEVYRPQRHFRRKDAPPEEEESRVQSTLLEYGYKQTVATPVLSAESVSCVLCQ